MMINKVRSLTIIVKKAVVIKTKGYDEALLKQFEAPPAPGSKRSCGGGVDITMQLGTSKHHTEFTSARYSKKANSRSSAAAVSAIQPRQVARNGAWNDKDGAYLD
jgi:hypothetical protein